ncbi:MAG: hypothetical protein HYV03_03210, partial [Deltaproteobacteria bacterium]|nr:hypothetical protein [Deltaproteobacteria bacterium]
MGAPPLSRLGVASLPPDRDRSAIGPVEVFNDQWEQTKALLAQRLTANAKSDSTARVDLYQANDSFRCHLPLRDLVGWASHPGAPFERTRWEANLAKDPQWGEARGAYVEAGHHGDFPALLTHWQTIVNGVVRASALAQRADAIAEIDHVTGTWAGFPDKTSLQRVRMQLDREQRAALKWIDGVLTDAAGDPAEPLSALHLGAIGDHLETLRLPGLARPYFERAAQAATTMAEKQLMTLRAIQQMPSYKQAVHRNEVEAIRAGIPDLLCAAESWERQLAQEPPAPKILLPDFMEGLPFDQIPFDTYPTVTVDAATLTSGDAPPLLTAGTATIDETDERTPIIILYEGRPPLPDPPPGSVSQVRLLYPLAWQVAYAIAPTPALEAERRTAASRLLGLSAIARYPISQPIEGASETAFLPDFTISTPTATELALHLANAQRYGQRWTARHGQLETLLANEGTATARVHFDQVLLPDLLDAAQLATLADTEHPSLHEMRGDLLGIAYDDGLAALDLSRERLRHLAELATDPATAPALRHRIAILRERAPWVFSADGRINPDVDISGTAQGELAAATTRARYLTSQNFIQESGLPIGTSLLGGALGLFCGPAAWVCVPAGGALGGGAGKAGSAAINLYEHAGEIGESGTTGLTQITPEEASAYRIGFAADLGLNMAFGVIAGPGGRAGVRVATTAARGIGTTFVAFGHRIAGAVHWGSISSIATRAVAVADAVATPANWPRGAQWIWTNIQTPRLSASDRFFISGAMVAADYGGFFGEAGRLDHWVGYAGIGLAGINPATLRATQLALQGRTWQTAARYLTGEVSLATSSGAGLRSAFQRVFSLPTEGPVPAELLHDAPLMKHLAAHYRLYRLDLAGATPQLVRVGAWDTFKNVGATVLTDGERIGAACFLVDLAHQKDGAALPQLTMGGALCFMLAANRVAVRHFNIDRAGTWTMFFMDRTIDAVNQVTSGRSPWNIDAYRVAMNYVSGGVVSLVRGRYIRNMLARDDIGLVKGLAIKTGPAYSEPIALSNTTSAERALAAKLLRSSTMADNALTLNTATGTIGRNGLNGHPFVPTARLTEEEQQILARWLQPGIADPAPLATIMTAQAIVGRTVANHRVDLLYLTGDEKKAKILSLLREECQRQPTGPAEQWLTIQLNHLEHRTDGAQLKRWLGPHLERSVAASQVGLNKNGYVGLKINADLTTTGALTFSSLQDTILGSGWDYLRAIYLLHGDPVHMMQWAWLRGFTTLPARNFWRLRHGWDTKQAWYGDRVLKWVGDPLATKFTPLFSNQGFWKEQYHEATRADSPQGFLDFHVARRPWQGGLDAYNWATPLAALGIDTGTAPYSPIGKGYEDLARLYASGTEGLTAADWEGADRFVDSLLTEAKQIVQNGKGIGKRITDYDDRTLLEHAMAIGLAAWHGHEANPARFEQTARNHADLFNIFNFTLSPNLPLDHFPDLVDDH